MPDVPISDHLAFLARRFNIDLPAVADEALREHLLREPLKAFTPRMRAALLAAREEANRLRHSHIGTEHVFLGILLDPDAIPTQLLRRSGTLDDAIEQLRALLGSDEYNQRRRTKE
jgi:ATP-dependent Clp protease ATP-binding subunit ClpC